MSNRHPLGILLKLGPQRSRMRLESSPPPTASAPSPSPLYYCSSSPCSTAPPTSVLLFPSFWFRCIVDKQRVQGKCVGEDEIANVVSTDGERVEGHRIAVTCRHFNGFEMRIHLHVDAYRRGVSVARTDLAKTINVPVMVPLTTDPFLSSMETVSLFSFIKNLM